jgi:protein-S-isoprenylcysteine O-methyltransferase Ste14
MDYCRAQHIQRNDAMPHSAPQTPPSTQPWLALKLPPVALVAIAAALMWALPPLVQLPLADAWRMAISAALALAGALVCVAGVLAFRRARTTVDPMHPGAATSLVVHGIYNRTRNPMYLGFALALMGWGLVLAKLSALLVLPLFVLYLNRYQIQPEDAALRERFGADFDAYAARVRRWV